MTKKDKNRKATIGYIQSFMSKMIDMYEYEKKVSIAETKEDIPKVPQNLRYFHKIMSSQVNTAIMRVYNFGKLIRTEEITVEIATQSLWKRIKNGLGIIFKKEINL